MLSDTGITTDKVRLNYCLNAPIGARCFLTDLPLFVGSAPAKPSQCTFWRSVLSDSIYDDGGNFWKNVLMHLLALGAF